jgi:HlyD family secretion protein
VSVANPEKKLLPGMTARVEFLTSSANDVLKVANSALRFKPADDAVVVQTGTTGSQPVAEGQRANRRAESPSVQGAPQGGRRGPRTRGNGGFGTLYTVDEKGQLHATRVRTGLTDGSMTEIRGRDLKEGMNVIAGTATPQSASATTSNASPFQNNNQQQQRGPRPGGF